MGHCSAVDLQPQAWSIVALPVQSLELVQNLRTQAEEEPVAWMCPIRADRTGQGKNQQGEASSVLAS